MYGTTTAMHCCTTLCLAQCRVKKILCRLPHYNNFCTVHLLLSAMHCCTTLCLAQCRVKKILCRLPQYNNCCTVHLLLSISIYVFHLFTAQSVPRQVHSPVVYLMDIITVWMIYIVIFSLQDCGMYCMQVTILFHRITRQSITQHFIYTQK